MNKEATRGLYTDVIDIRRRVFAEVAKVVLGNDHNDIRRMIVEVSKIPFRIIGNDNPTYRCCAYKERAIVTERVRLALGLQIWEGALNESVFTGLEEVLKPGKEIFTEIVRVIPEACERCPEKSYKVTDNCRKCLAHPCSLVCPADAVYFDDKTAIIDQDKCIKCGKCQLTCPYNAIVNYDRPCSATCGVNAIFSDSLGRAKIDHTKCVNCGMCIVACPFGSIADKSEFSQILIAIKEERPVYAIIAPSFTGQFGPLVTPGRIVTALKMIGFKGVKEVAFGADVATMLESKEWHHKVYEEEQPFLGTSCCPAWADMARKLFPEVAENISDSFTPMVATGKLIKELEPEALVTFIGPCIAKKAESVRDEVSPFVDFVITFEELAAIFFALDIDLAGCEEDNEFGSASGSGRHYAVSGGVADALRLNIEHFYPEAEVRIEKSDSLAGCKKMLMLAKAGRLDANLLEGMACPSGCVGGPGIVAPIRRTAGEVSRYSKASDYYPAYENDEIEL